MANESLILATASVWRRQLLESTGLRFSARPAGIDEEAIRADTPAGLALARAEAKAMGVAGRHPGALVIGADQVLSFAGQTQGKPRDRQQAGDRLRSFAGRTHVLHSAYALATGGKVRRRNCVDVTMTMRPLTDADIGAYLDTGEWQGCVGCYQYENRGIHLFPPDHMADQSAVVGLPLLPLLADLRELGVDALHQASD